MSVRLFCSSAVVTAIMTTGWFAAPAAAQTRAPLTGAARWADTVRVSIDRAVVAGDTTRLAAARALAERALRAFPDDALLLHYAGTTHWREGQLRMATGADDAARESFTRAITLLQRSASLRPMAETYGVLSSSLGSLAGSGMAAGIRYGGQANEAEETARTLSRNNPRVLLLAAISAFYKPSLFGGGKQRAREHLTQALTAFETDTSVPPFPSWGRAEAYAWLGQLESSDGNPAAARAAYQRSLELEPEYAWVRYALLPALDRRR